MRDGLEGWWYGRLSRRAPLAIMVVAIEEAEPSNDTVAWMQAVSQLQPMVRVAAFCQYKPAFEAAQSMGLLPFAAVERLIAPETGLEGGAGDRMQSYRAMVTHIEAGVAGGRYEAPVFYGALAAGATFPDAQGLVDTLFGAAADIRERRLPASVALVSHARSAESFASAGIRHGARESAAWSSLSDGFARMRPDEPGALAAIWFTPGAVEWDLHGGIAASDPAHLGAIVRARRHAYALAAEPGRRSAAAMAAAALVDVTSTVPVVRLRLGASEAAAGWAGSKAPAGLLDGSGRAMPHVTVEEAELASFREEVELEGAVHDVKGHIVVGWRGPVSEILRMEEEEEKAAKLQRERADKTRGQDAVKDEASPSPTPKPQPSPSPSPDTSEAAAEPVLSAFTTLFHTDRSSTHGEQKYQIQRNTLVALSAMSPEVELTVFTTSEQVESLCEELGEAVTCSRSFKSNKHGTPLLKSMFRHVEDTTSAPVYGYVNADILFDHKIVEAVRTVLRGVAEKKVHERVLIIGRRTNFQMPPVIDDSTRWKIKGKDDLKSVGHMGARGELFQTNAEDFFFIRRGSFVWSRVHDFVIGRVAYDNWLVDHAYHDGMDRVDVSETVHAVHQTGVDGNKAGHKPRVDKDWNVDLVKWNGGGYDHGDTHHANWETTWHADGHKREMRLRSRPLWHSSGRPGHLDS